MLRLNCSVFSLTALFTRSIPINSFSVHYIYTCLSLKVLAQLTMSSHCAQEEQYDCKRCIGRLVAMSVPAATEVLDKLRVRSFLI